jgi:hypothetical protein
MEKHPKPVVRPPPAPPQEPRAPAEHTMHNFKHQLGLDERTWNSILMSVREPSWEPHGEPRR